MQDFSAFVREHVKNTSTKPVQADPNCDDNGRDHERKNPGSAATETGIKSKAKASSFPRDPISKTIAEATCIQGGELLQGGAS